MAAWYCELVIVRLECSILIISFGISACSIYLDHIYISLHLPAQIRYA